MAFPKRLLIPGEELILDLRPHWIALALPALATLAILVAMIFGLPDEVEGGAERRHRRSVSPVFVLILIYPVPHLVRWLTSNFVVTSDRLIHREGFIAKRSVEIPLEAINDIRFQQSVFERIVGAGAISTSGRRAEARRRTPSGDVRKPESVQKTVYHQMELNSKRMYTGRRGGPGDQGR